MQVQSYHTLADPASSLLMSRDQRKRQWLHHRKHAFARYSAGEKIQCQISYSPDHLTSGLCSCFRVEISQPPSDGCRRGGEGKDALALVVPATPNSVSLSSQKRTLRRNFRSRWHDAEQSESVLLLTVAKFLSLLSGRRSMKARAPDMEPWPLRRRRLAPPVHGDAFLPGTPNQPTPQAAKPLGLS